MSVNTTRPATAADVPSPCVKVCAMDPVAGWCRGCLRTLDEIARWGSMTAREKHETLARISTRRRDGPA